jgi:signal transduction histidine kinase
MSERILDQQAFKRFLFRSVVWPIVLMAGLCIVLVWQIMSLINASARVARSDAALAQLDHLEKDYIDLETGVRGFLITGEPSFLEPFETARDDIGPLTAKAHTSLMDPSQRQELEHIDALHDQWLAYADHLIAIREGKSTGDWQSVIVAGHGKGIMDKIRGHFDQIIGREGDLRNDRNAAASQRATYSVIITCTAALLVGGFFSFLSKRQLEYLSRVYQTAIVELEKLNTGLEQRVQERTTELATVNHSLAEANTELEAFAYSISHDLRAPMRHITGFADMLRNSTGASLSADDKENLDVIFDTARLAGRMVDDLLAFSRVGRVQLAMMSVNMNSLVEQCRRDLQLDTQHRQIEWAIATLPGAFGDPSLLKLALQNLISNAVKYTANRPAAKIEIGGSADGAGATYFIRDNGVGFDMEYAHKLFGVFQRLHRAEEFEGTGIGLANARRIISRHGGRIWAEGAKDWGATFSFWLPSANKESDE